MDVVINGITVIFPYKPYGIQIDYMTSVISALQKKENALLESPTGTGKTLSLLCSTLAWLDNQKYLDLNLAKEVSNDKDYSMISNNGNMEDDLSGKKKSGKGRGWKNENPIRIIYSSRTHSQLNQACSELKRSYYKFIPTVTIGSRDQLCINPEVTKLDSISAKNQSCRMKVKSKTCKFHNNYEQKVSDMSFSGTAVYDIEDLIKFGNENKACPYYMAKAKTDFNTSLIFMPYNYIIDPSIRRTLKLNLENCVIIFDEGHNIERVCEDSMSTELKSESLAMFIQTFDSALKSLKLLEEGKYDGMNEKELSELTIQDVAKIKMVMCDLEMELDRVVRNPNSDKTFHQTNEIFAIFEKAQLDYQVCGLICSICEKVTAFVMSSTTAYMTNVVINSITSICNFIETVIPFSNVKSGEFSNYKAEFIKNYKLYSEIDKDNGSFNTGTKNAWFKKKSSQSTWTLSLWCMSPSVAIKSLKSLGIYNLIITSGTLAPLESFECEMGIPFPQKLQNTHVIGRNQLSIQLIFKDPNGHDLSGGFENRNDVKYYSGLGFTLMELARTVPKGMFVFFSSYTLINKCIDMWKNRQGVNLWTAINGLKQVFVEPRNKNEFYESINTFKETVDAAYGGAIFMGVSRGKLSEGMDLGDDYCRAVVIVGLPYPARYDPKVVLKQKYLDENNAKINGMKWYMLQMKRALNQSIGRVVRHKNDYGAIIICDSRFRTLNDGLSKWIQLFLTGNMAAKMNSDFKTKMMDIQNFYQNIDPSTMQKIVRKESSLPPTITVGNGKSSTNSNFTANSKNDSFMESTFGSMKNNYLANKANGSSTSHINSEANSLFNTFSFSNSANKKRNLDSSNTAIGWSLMNNGSKRTKPFNSVGTFPETTAANQFSQYFTRPSNSKSFGNTPSSGDIPGVINLDDEDDDKIEPAQPCAINASPSSNRMPLVAKSEPNTPTLTSDYVNFNSEEIIALSSSIFKNDHENSTYQSIINEVKYSHIKSRQFIETLRIYSKKGSWTYLALRMNFILDNVDCEKRNLILKDLSLILPERERQLFLGTCKVI